MPQNDKERDAMLKTAEDMLALSSDSENITAPPKVSDNHDQMIASPADSGIFSPPISPATPKASSPKATKKAKAENIVHFMFHLLQKRRADDVITWDDYEKGIFKILDSEELARLWGEKKGNPEATYNNIA